MTTTAPGPGRVAQRRRTRRAIVDATMTLLSQGVEPSVNEIAAAADVSRRTVYMHFPTLDQLILDATVGLMNVDVDAALERVRSDDAGERLTVLIDELYTTMEQSLPLGRRLIKLTVNTAAPASGEPRRGFRRIAWIEWALEPLRSRLEHQRYDELVSSLAMVIGWEAFIVLSDVRGLSPKAARDVTRHAALALLAAAERGGPRRKPSSSPRAKR
jgi:AcrR family transcriptional regulator